MLRKVFLTLIGIIVVIGAILMTKLGQFSAMGKAAENMVLPPETITAMTVEPARWERFISATGTVTAVQGVTVAAEAAGRVSEIVFESGALVDEGDILLRLDTATETAELTAAEAAASLAKTELKRLRKLGERDLASDDSIDRASAEVKETAAQVGLIRAQIAKKTVRAPFAGRLGLRQVNLGQILQEGDAIVSLQTLAPIYVDFSIPQQHIQALEPGMQVRVTTDTTPDEVFEARIVAVSPEIDTTTRNVRVRALIEHPRNRLNAGMFVRIQVVLPGQQDVLPVIATAVLYAPYGDSVFVVEDRQNEQTGETEQVLRQQFVRLGRAYGDFVDVIDGLNPGDIVVSSGAFKLSSGMKVVIDNTLAPVPSLEPSPADS